MIYCFDLDGTLCTSVENSNYELAEPDVIVINEINRLHEQGDVIKIMTARGCVSNKDYTELTNHQLSIWGVKYNELIMNKKPHANIFIDDRGIQEIIYFTLIIKRRKFICFLHLNINILVMQLIVLKIYLGLISIMN